MSTGVPSSPDQHPFGKPPAGLPSRNETVTERRSRKSDVVIEELDLANKRDRALFVDMVEPIYAGDPNYVRPLRMMQMEFLDAKKNVGLANLDIRALVAKRGGKIVGRITAHIDRAYDAYHGVKAGWFGFFESIDDRDVAHALLDEAVKFCTQRGASEIIGPCNFTTNHQVGLLVENFARPAVIEMTYNPPYYASLIESYGFGKAKDLWAWWIDVRAGLENPKIKRFHDLAEKVKKRAGLTIRSARMADFESEVALIFKLYNESWQKNWGFVPVNEAEFTMIAKDLKQIIVDSLVLIVEHKGTPVGFSVTLPNVSEIMPKDGKLFPFGWWKPLTAMKTIKTARLITLGVVPTHRKRGVESLLCIETALRSKELGMIGGEIGWTLEDNDLINRACESMGAALDRKYRLFGIDLRQK